MHKYYFCLNMKSPFSRIQRPMSGNAKMKTPQKSLFGIHFPATHTSSMQSSVGEPTETWITSMKVSLHNQEKPKVIPYSPPTESFGAENELAISPEEFQISPQTHHRTFKLSKTVQASIDYFEYDKERILEEETSKDEDPDDVVTPEQMGALKKEIEELSAEIRSNDLHIRKYRDVIHVMDYEKQELKHKVKNPIDIKIRNKEEIHKCKKTLDEAKSQTIENVKKYQEEKNINTNNFKAFKELLQEIVKRPLSETKEQIKSRLAYYSTSLKQITENKDLNREKIIRAFLDPISNELIELGHEKAKLSKIIAELQSEIDELQDEIDKDTLSNFQKITIYSRKILPPRKRISHTQASKSKMQHKFESKPKEAKMVFTEKYQPHLLLRPSFSTINRITLHSSSQSVNFDEKSFV